MSRRRLACLLLAPIVFAASVPAKKVPHPARTPARQERESREDLERRVERLEQEYELKEPAVPPAEPAAPRPAP